VVLVVADATGRIGGTGWDTVRRTVVAVAVLTLLLSAAVGIVVVRARPAVSPTVPITRKAAPDLYRLVGELAERLDVPAPSAIELTPDCDSWLEDRTHPATRGRRSRQGSRQSGGTPPVLVIGSPFLWWMRVAELRAVLAPVVAGTGPSAHPDIAAARRFVRGLDAAVAVAARRPALAFVGWTARALLVRCQCRAADMERGVAAAASARAQSVDYGLRIVSQEQVGLAYAGWDRLLTRVALPAWRMGRWPSRLDAGVVAALTELSRRDRLAEGFASRLGERPACDLLEEPGAVDEAASLLAALLFHGGPAVPGPHWMPVDWDTYAEEVVDRKWRMEAARLHRVLDDLPPVTTAPYPSLPTTAGLPAAPPGGGTAPAASAGAPGRGAGEGTSPVAAPTLARVVERLTAPGAAALGEELADRLRWEMDREEEADRRAARHTAELSAEGTTGRARPGPFPSDPAAAAWSDPSGALGATVPSFPIQPPRTGRELLADHVTAMICCAAVDTAGAAPGLDWLDGPVLLLAGKRGADLGTPVSSLLEDGDPGPLHDWLTAAGVRYEKPVRLA
jgi:hypothetical protein